MTQAGAKAARNGPASARGLFRSMGKDPKPVDVLFEYGVVRLAEGLPRDADDFYPTREPEPVRALLAHEGGRLADFPLIWEPAAGDGTMMRQLGEGGHACVGSDLIDRGCGATIRSFLDFTAPLAPAVVTNPPFALCNWRDGKGIWIEHAMARLGLDYMALLLSWNWPGAGGLGPLWAKHPPARVYLMRWKIDFTGQGAPPALHGWFVWDRAHRGETLLRMMDRTDHRQGCLFGGAP